MTRDGEVPDDSLLLEALAHGEAAALLALHDRHAGCLLTLAEREGLSDPGQAVEDAFVLIFRSAGCFARSKVPPPVWIIGIALRHFRWMKIRRMGIDAA